MFTKWSGGGTWIRTRDEGSAVLRLATWLCRLGKTPDKVSRVCTRSRPGTSHTSLRLALSLIASARLASWHPRAKEKPKELHEALERKRKENWELLELCYAEISVKLFRQLGLSDEETIAKALQEEYFFHFGVRPAVYAYDYTLIDETERRFRRVLEEANAKYLLEHYENAKVVLPGEKV